MSKAKKELMKQIDKFVPKHKTVNEEGFLITDKFATGIEAIDAMLGGGLPRGLMVGLSAEEGGGKTTMAIQMGGNIIEKYGVYVYYFDVEGGASPELINGMGYGEHVYHPELNPDGKFIRMTTKRIQEIAKIFKNIVELPDTGVIIIDSTTSTADKRQLEDEQLGLDKTNVGTHARMWSEAIRNMNALMDNSTATMIVVHQARDNLSQSFRVETEAARGRALKHYTSADIYGRVGRWLDADGDEVKSRAEAEGATIHLTTTKNRFANPYVRYQVPLIFGKGFSNKWAYREWLENVEIVNETTGEIVKVLNVKGGGYATLTLPSGSYDVRGKVAINALIDEHIEEILTLIKARGGLGLKDVTPINEASQYAEAFGED